MSNRIQINSNLGYDAWSDIRINIPEYQAPAMYLQELSEVMERRFRMWSDDGTRIIYETAKELPIIISESRMYPPMKSIEQATEFIRWRSKAKADMKNDPYLVAEETRNRHIKTLATMYSIKDSGIEQVFDTGAQRNSDEGKPRYDLIPPVVLKELALHYMEGGKIHGDRNWEKGQPIDRLAGSLLRHYFAWAVGEVDEPHMRALIWNAFAILYNEVMIPLGKLPRSLVGSLGVLARKYREEEK